MKYTDDLTLLAKKEVVLHGMLERLTGIGKCYGTVMNVEKNYGDENLQATDPNTDYGRSNTAGECRIFQLFG
jgi:hypothetical protein